MSRRPQPSAAATKPAVDVVRISLDGAVAVERLSGRSLGGRRPRLSFLGLLALFTGYALLVAVASFAIARWYHVPLSALGPNFLAQLGQGSLHTPATTWVGYAVSPLAIMVCLFLSGVDMRREQSFWIFFIVTLSSIAFATWKTVKLDHWLGFPVYAFFLWIVAYGYTANLVVKLRRHFAREQR